MAQPYLLGTMNMILHGIEAPNMIHVNTLTEDTADIQEKDRFDYILANPPFGGKEKSEVQVNFPVKTGAGTLVPPALHEAVTSWRKSCDCY